MVRLLGWCVLLWFGGWALVAVLGLVYQFFQILAESKPSAPADHR